MIDVAGHGENGQRRHEAEAKGSGCARDGARPDRSADSFPREAGFRWTRLWPLGALVAVTGALLAAGAGEWLSLSTVIRRHGELATLVADHVLLAEAGFLVLYTAAVALSFPGASVLTILGGYLFGAAVGTGLTIVAATAGATVIFLVARTSLGDILREKAGGFGARVSAGFEANAFNYLLFLRLVPVFPFWLLNILPALFNVPTRTFVAATALGIVPGTLAYSLLGSGLGGAIEEMEAAHPGCAAAGTCKLELSALLTPGPLVAMAALTIAAVVPLVVKRLRRRAA